MKIEYRTGNVLQAPERHLVHGCNAQGVMGSGLAKGVRAAYPEAYEAYMEAHRCGSLGLGRIVWAACGARVIGNAITQDRYGRDPGTVYADYDAIRQVFRTLEAGASRTPAPFAIVALPLIGAGLANGSWSRIAAIVEEEAVTFQPVVYLLDGVVPKS